MMTGKLKVERERKVAVGVGRKQEGHLVEHSRSSNIGRFTSPLYFAAAVPSPVLGDQDLMGRGLERD